jgi:GT2 family glycosyltransferase
MKPELSIIIATLGFDSLKFTLNSILENKKKHDIEILVIGYVKDEIMNEYTKYKFIKHFPCKFEHGDLSNKRNLGFEKSKSDIVAFIDDDVEITKEWIENGLKHFKDGKIGIVSGPGIPPKKAGFFIELFGTTMASIGAGPMRKRYIISKKIERDFVGDKIIGCNMFIRKSVFEKIGGFNPDIIPAEEIDFAARAIKSSYEVYMDPESYLIHFARSNPKKFFRQIFRFGRSKINTMRRKTIDFNIIFLIPVFALIFFLGLIIESFFSLIVLNLTLFFLGIYFIFILLSSIISLIATKRLVSLFLILTIPLMHFAYAVGEFCELFKIKTSLD